MNNNNTSSYDGQLAGYFKVHITRPYSPFFSPAYIRLATFEESLW
jgi:hypothetical protein